MTKCARSRKQACSPLWKSICAIIHCRNRFKGKLTQSYPSVQRRRSTRRCPPMTDTLRKRTRGGTSSTWQRASTKILLGTSLQRWKGRMLSSSISSLFDGEQSKNMFSKTRNKRPTIGREEINLVLFAVDICKKHHKESTKKLLEIEVII